MRWVGVGILFGALLSGATSADAAGPSFDCGKATSWTERTICKDRSLASLDREMAAAFSDARRRSAGGVRGTLVAEQRRWLRGRDACRRDSSPAGCLAKLYRARVATLTGASPAPRPAPSAPAEVPSPPAAAESAQPRPAARGVLGECQREAAEGGVGLCLDRKLADATTRMAEVEDAMLRALAPDEDATKAFRDAQDTFLVFRDATCRWRGLTAGDERDAIAQACMVEYMRARGDEIAHSVP